jgi:hypothetical protein
MPMRPSGSGGAGAPAALALLDDVHRHRLRRAALHLPPPGAPKAAISEGLIIRRATPMPDSPAVFVP